MAEDSDAHRRSEELDALQAFYGENVEIGNEKSPENGPWRIRIAPKVILELVLPLDYPTKVPPSPQIHAPPYVLNETYASDLIQEMVEMWSEDTEVAISWAEHCRATLDHDAGKDQVVEDEQEEGQFNNTPVVEDMADDQGTRTFHPYNSKYGQPVRHFEAAVILNEANRQTIHRGQRYHPPKSGPSEIMLAHVASVKSMDHVNWFLAELLFNDKKVSRAAHNMVAYRFWDTDKGCMVSDNDDDGEKGGGSKLAALLDIADARDVMVVVSRWFGGVLLGPSRFKYIASTARDALKEAGFIQGKN